MFNRFARGLSAIAMTGVLLGAEPTQACCLLDWCTCFKPKPATYCPPPPVAVCPQQISYVPQTTCACAPAPCPCTACQPVNACDPCGGAPMVMQTSYAPRTSMRPIVTPLGYGAAYSSPYYSGMPTSSCPTCGGGGATVGYAAPASATVPVSSSAGYAMPAYATQPAMSPAYAAQPAMQPSYAAQPQMGQPYGAQPSYAAQPQMADPNAGSSVMSAPSLGSPTPAAPAIAPNTFQPSSTTPPSNSSLMPTAPIPDNNSGGAPRLLDPTRTTSAQIIGPVNVTHAVFNTADRSHVFRAIGYQPNNQRATESTNDGWSGNADNWQSSQGR
jgi:hypothetical protein